MRGMKPAFALDFRNDAIALLHRTSGGWHHVGRVTLDDPDLPAALGYLRSTALGLSPRGLATKLVLPDDQLLVTTVDAPGPDDPQREAQIRSALVGRTPYAVEDLVFDWEVVGDEVRVAVVARETLAEVEAFASEHRFNPVSFAAGPARGYAGEAWFGVTAQAAGLLAEGETVEPDAEQVVALARSPATNESVTQTAAPSQAPQIPKQADGPAQPELALAAPEAPADADAAPADSLSSADAEPAQAPAAEPPVAEPPVAEAPAVQEAAAKAPSVAPRETPIFGLADDEPPPSAVFATSATAEPASGANQADLPADLLATLQEIKLEDEAPMALDVEDDESLGADDAGASSKVTAPGLPDDVPPPPGLSASMGFASRRASTDAGQSAKAAAPTVRPTVDRPTAARPLFTPPAPKAERAPIDRPTAAKPLAPKPVAPKAAPPKPVAAKEGKGLRSFSALVTAPGLPGIRKAKGEAAPSLAPNPAPSAAATASATTPAAASAKPFGGGLGGRPKLSRGKPRYLGLILTGILLLILAAIAAWSTSLAFRSVEGADTEIAATSPDALAPATEGDLPAAEDEMLADGQDAEALADGAALPDGEALADTPAPPADLPLAEAAAPEAAPPGPAPVMAEDTAAATTAQNPTAASGDEIFLAANDQVPSAPEPLDLPEVSAQGDPLPMAQAPPPPFGTVYQFDANGLIVPTPEGIITPEGVRLVAGKPPLVPKARPEGLAPAQAETAAAAPAPSEAFPSDPALSGFRPKARPAGLTPPTPEDDAALPVPVADSRLAGLRPKARPEAVLAAGEAVRAAQASAANSGSIYMMGQAASAEQAAAASASGSQLAVAISRKPQPRPRDLSRAVEAAVAAAIRNPTPEPDPPEEPQKVAASAPTPKANPKPEKTASSAGNSAGRGRDINPEDDGEPDIASAAPRVASTGSVAKQATFKNALALDKTALIGVYGTPSARYAMIRTANGRYKKVKIGDSIDGGKVQAVTASEVRYQKGTRLVTLSLPKS